MAPNRRLARAQILRIFQQDNAPLSAGELGQKLGHYRQYIHEMLKTMLRRDELERLPAAETAKRRYVYRASHRGLMVGTRETVADENHVNFLDHRALTEALGMSRGVPPSLARLPAREVKGA